MYTISLTNVHSYHQNSNLSIFASLSLSLNSSALQLLSSFLFPSCPAVLFLRHLSLQLSCSSVFLYKSRSCSITTYSLEIHLNLFARLSPLVSALFLTNSISSLSSSLFLYVPASLISLLFLPSHFFIKSPFQFSKFFMIKLSILSIFLFVSSCKTNICISLSHPLLA